MLVDVALEGDSSEGESTDDRWIPQVEVEDRGYDSCDSEDMNTGFRRYKKHNLAAWLGPTALGGVDTRGDAHNDR